MPTCFALLRAVNVGGRILPMADFRAALEALGLRDVRTLLQSGNAAFTSDKTPDALEAAIEKRLADKLKIATDVFVRTSREWDAAIAANPFPQEAEDDPAHLVIVPLKDAPKKGALEALRAAIKGRERADVVRKHAYLVYPDGIGHSKLTMPVIEAKLGTRGTGRNWNTARKLAAMAHEDDPLKIAARPGRAS